MDYQSYEVEDFLLDQRFLKWVKRGHDDTFWQDFQLKFPEKKAEMEKARVIILAGAGLSYVEPAAEVRTAMWENIQSQTVDSITETKPGKMVLLRSWWWAAAAILLVGSMIGWQLKINQGGADKISYEALISEAKTSSFIEKINDSEKTLLVNLPDGSSVLLEKGGKLSYDSKAFGQNKREVFLSGAAFFEVSKDPARPFFVYANELITKVLGTSFTIRALPGEKHVEVLVKTGRVAVFTHQDPSKNRKLGNRELEGVVVAPNQQITLERTELHFLRTLVPDPQMLEIPAQKVSFDFDDVPAPKVLELIEKAYGVDIVYDEDLLANCMFTAHLNDEPLNDKIRLICEGLQAEHEIIDGQIVITSKGCSR